MKPTVYVIGGPTASGKSKLAVELAKKINGEIISADSMQIYKDMNIGTAKPTQEEMQGIKHYLIDIISPNERYSVADYKRDAKKAIKEIINKGTIIGIYEKTFSKSGKYSGLIGLDILERSKKDEYLADIKK